MIFSGFERCLYRRQKFESDPERGFAVILEKKKEDVLKWFRPTKRDLHIYYSGESAYEPDFVVETKTIKMICEIKRASEMQHKEVLDKARAAAQWCRYATEHAKKYGGKPWSYLLIPDDAISENKTLQGLAASYTFDEVSGDTSKGLG